MSINSILNFFSFSQALQENGEQAGFAPQSAVIGTLAAGALAVSAQYGYAKYSAYRIRCQEYREFCRGIDRWCQEAEEHNLPSRSRAADLIKECYWKKEPILDLSLFQLTSLPPEIGELTHLQKLNLSYNRLQQLPPEIGQLTKLQELHIPFNELQQLPPEIGELRNLQQLILTLNQLRELPPEIGGLTNLETLRLDSNHDLQALPEEILRLRNLQELDVADSTIEASQAIVATFRNRNVAVNYVEQGVFHAHSTTFTLNLQQVQNDPISVLRALQKPLKEDHGFPKIVYEGSKGLDHGALSRDLVTRLFQELFDKENPQLPVLELDDGFLPVVDAAFNHSESYQSQELYQAIGMIFGAAFRKNPERPIITGKHFHPILFEMLYCLFQEDFSGCPDQFAAVSDLPKDILKKLLSSHLCSKADGPDDQKKMNASLLAEAYIENQFPDPFGVYESREEFLKVYPYADKVILAAPGVLAIAQGMDKFLNWHVNVASPADLQLNIEGYFSREEVKNTLSWQEEENSPQNDQTKEFLIRWIEDESTPLNTISQFLFAISGSSTIMKDQNLQVSFYSAEGPEEGHEWFPKYHACAFAMEIPRNYPDYETFKKMLEASIRVADFGFQTR
ncbi:MAG: leucine-rich repeat domain-containing protein [Chlamydiales bacterium]|nr:leucine-rich repeat domain-containing protein [Chlamydiales bacterium]